MVVFFFPKKSGGQEKKCVPYVFLTNLVEKVIEILDANVRYIVYLILMHYLLYFYSLGRLTTHNCIPESEIWLKVSGDKGGDTFKMTFQIINVPFPNSPDNTCIFAAFEAGDSNANLQIALEQFTSQVNKLQGYRWK